MRQNSLIGELPIEVSLLLPRLLWIIDLSGNQLFDVCPKHLQKMTKSEGSIPTMTNLRYLSKAQNHLTGIIPSQICYLTNLKVLSLSWNKLSGPLPSAIGRLEKIETIDFELNRLTGTIPFPF